ncbi:hypothetical protein BSUBE1_3021 [Bacillus subtilis E1]|nr:hypothetical protein BSMD_042420 [Bacillus subtilis Miyagi-4]CCU59652.1 hypothetical protein BSUBE1_3021 [Bacillus subtilis E1]
MAQKAETPATTTNQKHKGRQPVNKKAIRHISWIAFFGIFSIYAAIAIQ